MNIHSSRPLESDEPLASSEWTMTVDKNESGYYFASVARGGQVLCRLSLNSHFDTREAAERALASRAREWIADFCGRPTSRGNTRDEDRKRAEGFGGGSEQ